MLKCFLSFGFFLGFILNVSNGAYADSHRPESFDNSNWDFTNQTETMKEQLDLSDEQAAKILTILEQNEIILYPICKQLRADYSILKAKVGANAPDAELKEWIDSIKADWQKFRVAKKAEQEQIRAVLTLFQQAKQIMSLNSLKKQEQTEGNTAENGQ